MIMKPSTELIASRLFDGKPSQLTAWMENTQARSEQAITATKLQPLPLTCRPHTINDKATLLNLCGQVKQTGFALYEWSEAPANTANPTTELLQALSLSAGDKGVIRDKGELSLLQDLTGTPKGRFPPYQAKAMNWHTDGYYNDKTQMVRCFTLHCVAPASNGGALVLMDDAYLIFALWQEDPELVALLCHPEAMTLPHNQDSEGHNRPDRSVPVILCNNDKSLSMRFTTRTQHIKWRCEATQAAARRAAELINEHPHWHTRIKLQKDQGIITRNVLHARDHFVDEPGQPKRQILRGRFTRLPTPAGLTEKIQTPADNRHAAP